MHVFGRTPTRNRRTNPVAVQPGHLSSRAAASIVANFGTRIAHEMPNNAWRRPCEKSTNFSGWWLKNNNGIIRIIVVIIPINYNLVGGIPTPLKNDGMSNSWDDEIPNMMGKLTKPCSKPATRIFANILIKCESDFLRRCQRMCSGLAVSENRCRNFSRCFLHEAKSSRL